MNLFCLYASFSSILLLQTSKEDGFPFWMFLHQVLHKNLAFSRFLVVAVCSLCSTNCYSMATKGC